MAVNCIHCKLHKSLSRFFNVYKLFSNDCKQKIIDPFCSGCLYKNYFKTVAYYMVAFCCKEVK